MVPVLYVIVIESAISGLMLNRTLYSKTAHMWHLPVYVLIKSAVCTYAVYCRLLELVTPLCVLFSLAYALLCFSDSIKRKLLTIACGVLCLGMSNLIKFALLNSLGLTQELKKTPHHLTTVTVLCISLIMFCLFTIVFTNILCGVRFRIIGGIFLVNLFLILLICLVYAYMHTLVPFYYNRLYSIFSLFFLLPAVTALYLSENILYISKENYFRQDSE